MNSARKNAPRLLLALIAIGLVAALIWMGPPHRGKLVVALPTVARHDLLMRDKLWYQVSETNAFTGLMVDFYPNGSMMSRSMISNGLPNGWTENWYTNGQMQIREGFRNGVSDGLREKWYQNGRKMSEAAIVDGKITGIFQSWHENGQLSERIQMKQGVRDGTAWAYYPSGFAKAEIAMRDGKVLNRRNWKDGEYKTTQ
jgi:antitoxin component YwqK of YwqJK toxin-antitoxin module